MVVVKLYRGGRGGEGRGGTERGERSGERGEGGTGRGRGGTERGEGRREERERGGRGWGKWEVRMEEEKAIQWNLSNVDTVYKLAR